MTVNFLKGPLEAQTRDELVENMSFCFSLLSDVQELLDRGYVDDANSLINDSKRALLREFTPDF